MPTVLNITFISFAQYHWFSHMCAYLSMVQDNGFWRRAIYVVGRFLAPAPRGESHTHTHAKPNPDMRVNKNLADLTNSQKRREDIQILYNNPCRIIQALFICFPYCTLFIIYFCFLNLSTSFLIYST